MSEGKKEKDEPNASRTLKRRARAPALTGGEGFSYEDAVVALFLTALVREEAALGSYGHITRVAVQQDRAGEPMDDVVADSVTNGDTYRLSLQVKSSLKLSAADEEFGKVVREALATRARGDFDPAKHRYGFVVRTVANATFNSFKKILDWARASTTGSEFSGRFVAGGEASKPDIALRNELLVLLGSPPADDERAFYASFVAHRIEGLDEGGDRFTTMANQLGELAADGPSQGLSLATGICRLVRVGEGQARVWNRATLLPDLSRIARLRVAPSYAEDLAKLVAMAKNAVGQIRADIGGVEIDRSALVKQAEEVARQHRFSDIRGLPGTGKSVLLRRVVERALEHGPVLFLKADNLEGNSWASFAGSLGLRHLLPNDILAEIGAAGTATLFIDGIDRIPMGQRHIVTDLVQAIEKDPSLRNWTILATSRDQGLEVLRSWIPLSLHKETGAGNVEVGILGEDESEALAAQLPALRPLLFGAQAARDIARRPFFAAVLAKRAVGGAALQAPQTESQLVSGWWDAGGYNVPASDAPKRQRALLDLAEIGAPSLGKVIGVLGLREATVEELPGLIADRVIEEVEAGASYKFTHDIYFEWAFFRLLIAKGSQWAQALVAAGQAPLLARVVGLLSQHVYERDGDWAGAFDRLNGGGLRPQWRRAWLAGPPGSAVFQSKPEKFNSLVDADESALLLKFLTWFQAEQTVPNTTILQSNEATVSTHIRLRVADMMGWPSDIALWKRVLMWLFTKHADVPPQAVPRIVDIFAVWQNIAASIPNDYSKRIIQIAEGWMAELQADQPSRFDDLRSGKGTLIKSLQTLILRSAIAYPDAARREIDRVIALDRRRNGEVKDVLANSRVLAQACPEKLAELVCAAVMEELPKEKIERQRREREARRKAIEAVRAKPEAERTPDETRFLEHLPFTSSIGFSSSEREFNDFALEKEYGSFHPAAAGTEPFASLFRDAPAVARQLVRDLSNHANRAWLEDAEIHPHKWGTPIPLDIDFPWGRQRFWGVDRTYAWYFGEGGPPPLECAWLGLTYWAHKEIDGGRDVDEVIKDVVEGHDSWAALGLAVSLALEQFSATPVTVALGTSQRLWKADIRRQVEEGARGVDLFGWGINPRDQMDQSQKAATDYLAGRAYRSRTLKQMATVFALSSDEAIGTRFRESVSKFPDDLPFSVEEERGHQGHIADLLETATLWSGLGNKEHYAVRAVGDRPGMVMVEYQHPEPPPETVVKKLEASEQGQRELRQLGWANTSLQTGQVAADFSLEDAVNFARSRDDNSLFTSVSPGSGLTQPCVATTATVALQLSNDPETLKWAWSVMDRLASTRDEDSHVLYGKNNFDPRIAYIVALARDLQKSTRRADSEERLVRLAGTANPFISAIALRGLLVQTTLPEAAWNAAVMSSELFTFHHSLTADGGRDDKPQREHRKAVLRRALARVKKPKFVPLVPPPPAWVKEEAHPRGRRGRVAEDGESWTRPDFEFDPDSAAESLADFPFEAWCNDEARRPAAFNYLDALVKWTVDRLYPPWGETDRHDRSSADLFTWLHKLASVVARISPHLPADEFYARFVDPIARNARREDLQYLADVINSITCRRIYDAPQVDPDALRLLELSVDRLLEERVFDPTGYRAGEISDRAHSGLLDSLLLISVKDASGAARFANGEWTDLPILLPVVQRLMRATGWSDGVMEKFLTLVRRAGEAMPINLFIELVQSSLDAPGFREDRWISEGVPATLSTGIQQIADLNSPLTRDQAQGLLTILDRLVDMGDRRAAALQQSEHFRSVQQSAAA